MKRALGFLALAGILCVLCSWRVGFSEVATSYSYLPPFLNNSLPPMVMLTMARDHRLYYEAYNDASDINGDGVLDVRYTPSIDYYGYFDSYKYYEFNSTSDRFEPRGTTTTKKAPNGNYWSGDFLNYVSMTRMDCLRKVLYGGYRSTDTATETVLERAYIPQDAHSFGKDYESIARDGYDIREYTPLPLPLTNFRHLIATTALGTDGKPLLRVLNDSSAHIWEWVATERPVVKSNFGGSTGHPGHPNNATEFAAMVSTYATASRMFGSNTPVDIDGSGNPHGNDDNYLNIISGTLVISSAGNYRFAVDGDDAIEVLINGVVVAGWYGGHGQCGCSTHTSGEINLNVGNHTVEFRHEEASGGDTYHLYWKRPSANSYEIIPQWEDSNNKRRGLRNLTQTTYNLVTNAVITDYTLRVQVGVDTMPEPNAKLYPNGTYKPIGVLQRHGESDRMLFGLMTGSYTKNLSGGVLRQPMGSIRQEINTQSGEFLYQDNSTVGGIVRTLDKLRIHGFRNNSDFDYNENCAWITTTALTENQCRMWGNPMAEMMYETVRYFSGAGTPTSQFTYSPSDSALDDNQIGLPLATWDIPYNSTNYCAKPIMIAISDIFPSYDSDQLPGSTWPTTISSTLPGLNVTSGAQTITNHETVNGSVFIGQVASTYDGACTPKTISGLQDIRGLCPEEPSKQGAYYSAAVTHYAATTDISNATGNQTMASYMIALSSPLPEIKIPVGGNIITMVPFGKSVGGSSISAAQGSFQPTNTIVDFFVEEINPTNGTFRVNFEDVEQGADHDMDAIVRYRYEVVNNSTVDITLTSEYAAGGIIQHMGYIISGTTQDGTYLVVRDKDTAEGSDPDYHLDYPNNAGEALPLTSTLTFSPGTTTAASLLKTPLWYAAKWGGFEDGNNNARPDAQGEWDKDNDGVPDTYFYVANPTKLEEQLNKAFADILRRTSSGTAASITTSREGEGAIHQAFFYPEYKDDFGHTVNWAGELRALFLDRYGNICEDTNQNGRLDSISDKIVVSDSTGTYRYTDLDGNSKLSSSEKNSTVEVLNGQQDILPIWTSRTWLDTMTDTEAITQRSVYNATSANRYIITFADKNQNMIVDTGEIQDFEMPSVPTNVSNTTDFHGYLTLYPSFENIPSDLDTFLSENSTGFGILTNTLAQRQVNFIRGADQAEQMVSSYAVNATRSRAYTQSNVNRTWRLGDIMYSSPTVVNTPVENFDFIYRDKTFYDFFKKYRNRRQMAYVGANDGMLHAFNGGFFNSTSITFNTTVENKADFPLGTEMWAYVPYNLLPHLYWLTEPQYGNQLHVSYMDLKPRVFDARVFFQTENSNVPSDNSTYPHGWGTLLVAGMRLGGGLIRADLDKTDGNSFNAAVDRSMSSAYVVLDITNPEEPPKPLAEIRMPGQGFTTCYPTFMPMSTRDANATDGSDNNWYLVFGSGPANAAGEAAPTKIASETSDQPGQLFVLDLKALVAGKTIKTLHSNGVFTAGNHTFATTEPGSFISDPVFVDHNIDFKTDLIYYGTVAGDQTNPLGTMRRLTTLGQQPVAGATTWTGNTTLIDMQQPVVASPTVAKDGTKRMWVYFGTGRFFNRDDIPQQHGMSFYGIKEPGALNSTTLSWDYTWAAVDPVDLYNSTQITIQNATCGVKYTSDCISVTKSTGGTNATLTWAALISEVAAKSGGWRRDFSVPYERVITKPTASGGALFFTSYIPSEDLCAFEGNSSVWGLFTETGTAYWKPIFPSASGNPVYIPLGIGMAGSPTIYVPRTNKMPTIFIPTSTGGQAGVDGDPPFSYKTGSLFWLNRKDE